MAKAGVRKLDNDQEGEPLLSGSRMRLWPKVNNAPGIGLREHIRFEVFRAVNQLA